MYPVLHGGFTPMGYYGEYNRKENTTIVVNTGNAGCVFYSKTRFWSSDACFSLYPSAGLLDRYLYYVVYGLEHVIKNQIRAGAMPTIDASAVENLSIPVPPLPVQQEIVRILDSFFDLQDNLQQELEARKKQYRYYLDWAFSNAQGPLLTLGDIGTMKKGTGIQKADFREEGFPCIHYGQVHTYYGTSATKTKSFVDKALARSLATYGDLVIATTSEDVEACCKAVAWLGDTEVAVSGDAHIFHHNQNPKYISYLFQSEEFAAQKRMNTSGAKVVRVNGDAMLKFSFRIPSLEEQQKVVDILEQFEDIIQIIKDEMSARQKQYEYYREQLISLLKQ